MSQRPIELPDDHAIAGDLDGRNDRDGSSLNEQRRSRGPPCALCSLPSPSPPQPRLPRPFRPGAGGTQTVQLTKVDVIKVATGFRASKVIGSSVVNDAGDTVGKVDDIIIGDDGKAPFSSSCWRWRGKLDIGGSLVVLPTSS